MIHIRLGSDHRLAPIRLQLILRLIDRCVRPKCGNWSRRAFNHPGELTQRERRQAANAVVQMLEVDVFKKTVLELDTAFKRERLPVEMVLLLHDGIWLTCPAEMREKAKTLIKPVMENSVSLSVPLVVTID